MAEKGRPSSRASPRDAIGGGALFFARRRSIYASASAEAGSRGGKSTTDWLPGDGAAFFLAAPDEPGPISPVRAASSCCRAGRPWRRPRRRSRWRRVARRPDSQQRRMDVGRARWAPYLYNERGRRWLHVDGNCREVLCAPDRQITSFRRPSSWAREPASIPTALFTYSARTRRDPPPTGASLPGSMRDPLGRATRALLQARGGWDTCNARSPRVEYIAKRPLRPMGTRIGPLSGSALL
ncbi:hypothetical protein HPB50_018478 [Hyalomma asiaticum]|uniref:Uncharacterized protein n=1 Tax=Hyalomma asiaticum TaxID=266040 RepID=A0ACB7TLZ5_HYAAI|nr:hypothetical protein HPB50_018478 [Hyalomma asiaticum]